MSNEDCRAGILKLMGLLERSLHSIASRSNSTFVEQAESVRKVFSDFSGILDARRVRNSIAHGEEVSNVRAGEAYTTMLTAVQDILPHTPPRLQATLRAELNAPMSLQRPSPTPVVRVAPLVLSTLTSTSRVPQCDWVYFATPSQGGPSATRKVVIDLGLIIRPVYDSRQPPNAISNVRNIYRGHTVLLAYGSDARYQPLLMCKVVEPKHPIPGFDCASFAPNSAEPGLESSGFRRDPHFNRFTGIPVEPLPTASAGSFRKPLGNTVIRTWKDVEEFNRS